MSNVVSMKAQDSTRVDQSQAIRQYSANKMLGNAKFCTQAHSIVDEFGRPGNPRNLVNTGVSDCAMYNYPIDTFLKNENSIRPAQVISFLNTQGSGDTLAKGAKRDYMQTNLYNPSLNAQMSSIPPTASMYGGNVPQRIVYDPATLRLNPQNGSLFQMS